MRIFEITSAEEQLSLLRLIIDSTWSAIATQADQQQKDEQRKTQARTKIPLNLKGKLKNSISKTQVKKPKAAIPKSPINQALPKKSPSTANQQPVKPGFQAMQVAR